jgi:hypothetical protein
MDKKSRKELEHQLAMSIAWPVAGGAYPLFLILFLRRPEVSRAVERWDP